MNYTKHYNLLVEKSPKIKPEEGYYEKHRIVPGCLGGKYEEGNIVWLTPEEHYVAHQLLVKIHPNNNKLVYAAHMMNNGRKNNKLYGWLRKKYSKIVSERQSKLMIGNNLASLGKGKPKSESWKQKNRKPKKGVVCPNCNKVGAGGVMYRWHFDNCKQK